jgi:hypothetical protein
MGRKKRFGDICVAQIKTRIRKGEQSGLLTRMAMESVSWCTPTKS